MNLRGILAKVTPDNDCLAVSANSLGQSLLGTLFQFYYIKVFLDVYGVSNAWQNTAQILFLVWNAVNDPLFGYFQDIGGDCGCGGMFGWIKDRKKVILYTGPLYAVSFMLPWLGPWARDGEPAWATGIHLLLSLFLLDTFMTLVGSANCGLFTEMTTDHKGRVRIVKYMQLASMVGTLSVFPMNLVSGSLSKFMNFQIGAAIVAGLAIACFIFSGLKSPDPVEKYKTHQSEKTAEPPTIAIKSENGTLQTETKGEAAVTHPETQTIWQRVKYGLRACKQIVGNRDFLCVTLTNFLHIMRITQNQNFLAIFTEALISREIFPLDSVSISVFYSACTTIPQLLILVVSPLLSRFGPWWCLMGSVVLTILNSITVYCIGSGSSAAVIAYLFIDSILGQSLWPAVYNIFFPNVIDEDFTKHGRSNPLSTLIFTLNALFTKPAYSLTPIIVVNIMNQGNRYETWKNAETRSELSADDTESLLKSMFTIACFYPLVLALAQVILMAPYRLKFYHKRSEPEETEKVDGGLNGICAAGDKSGTTENTCNGQYNQGLNLENEHGQEQCNQLDDPKIVKSIVKLPQNNQSEMQEQLESLSDDDHTVHNSTSNGNEKQQEQNGNNYEHESSL